MKEYNWRKEREKFQPDFNKRPQDPEPVQTPVRAPFQWGKVLAAVIIIAAVVIGIVLIVRGCHSQDSSARLAAAAEQYKEAVGLVVSKIELTNGKKIVDGVGTAWAVAPDKFVTNAHVAYGIKGNVDKAIKSLANYVLTEDMKRVGAKTAEEYVAKIGKEQAESNARMALETAKQMIKKVSGEVLINGCANKSFVITQYQIHRNYGVVNTSFDPDLAILTIDGKNSICFPVADDKTLYGLKAGEPIAFLGFPMENLNQNNVNFDSPIASMQSGIVVATSGFDMKDAGQRKNYLLRHNLPCTGGASGSPVFRGDGKVIGVLFAGNASLQIVKQGKDISVQRDPSGALINFAVRIDLLKDMGEAIRAEDFLKF